MAQYMFGVGILSFTPPGTNPTPVQVGVLQDVTLNVTFEEKVMYGANSFPVDIAKGKGKIEGSAKYGQIGSGLIGAMLSGSTTTTGMKKGISQESVTIPATPFQVTVANGATYFEDLGVIDTNTGLAMTRGATATGSGVYALNTTTGQYTFNTADSGHVCLVNYAYTVAGSGHTVSYSNQLMGSSVLYTVSLYNNFRSKDYGCKLYAASFSKLSFAWKQDDYSIGELPFQAVADSTGKVIDFWTVD
jgi:hypothetical protein